MGIVEESREALLRVWPPLRQAIESRVDELRARSELERTSKEWEVSGRRDSYLLRGDRLESARRVLELVGSDIDNVERVREFVSRSMVADRAGPPGQSIMIFEGSTICISDERGDFDWPAYGMFAVDTRMLSRFVLTINGARPLLLTSGMVEYFTAAFFMRNAES